MMPSRITAYVFAIAFAVGAAAFAPLPGPGFDLSWNTVDGGGGTSSGGGFELTGTTGQADAGVLMTGGTFELSGGFWAGAAPCPDDINNDGVTNVLDLIDLLLCFGLPAVPGCEAEDINEDGTVNVLDLIALLLEFGQACP